LGILCHSLFALAVLAMMARMFFGMSAAFGKVPWPWALLANVALIVQFPLAHSLLLTGPGGRLLVRLIPGPHGPALATTTYAIIASAQLLSLFGLWTPSGIIWWRAEGSLFWAISAAYAASWLLLLKASFDADLRSVPPDPPADLCRIRPDALDGAGVDAGLAGAGARLHLLLPARAKSQGAALCGAVWRAFRRVSNSRALCGAGALEHCGRASQATPAEFGELA
jgi:hypothetical protein